MWKASRRWRAKGDLLKTGTGIQEVGKVAGLVRRVGGIEDVRS